MKQLFPLITLAISLCSPCLGDSKNEHLEALDKIRSERLANFKAIVALIQRRVEVGASGMLNLVEAKLDLHKFERNLENSAQEKIAPQEKIVSLEELRHSLVTADMRSDQASDLDFLRSKERVLASKQLLLKLRAKSAPKAPVQENEESK